MPRPNKTKINPRRPGRYHGPAGPLGCHVGIAGGIDLAPARGRELGATAIQIFTRSPRMWAAPPPATETCERFRREVTRLGIRAVVAHGIYLVNLGSQNDALWEKSIAAVADEIERCAALGITQLVLHPGSAGEATPREGLARILAGLKQVITRTPDAPVRLLLENTAGSGASLGWDFAQLAWLIEHHPQPERFGVCLDTAHALAAGYALHEPDGLARTLAELDDAVGLDRLGCLHLNDSLKPHASRRDRHARIGQGELGAALFADLLAEPRLHGIPKILEVPGGDQAYVEDLRLLAKLARRAVTK